MIDFDAATGRLRLDQASFLAIVQHLDRDAPQPAPAQVAALETVGVLTPGGVHESLLPAFGAVLAPACQLRMTVADASSAAFHQGWVGGAVSAMLVQSRGELHELLTLPTSLLATFVASTTRVGPRQVRAEASFAPAPQALDDLLDLDGGVRRVALQAVRATAPTALADAIDADQVWMWGVESAWPSPAGTLAGSWLQVLDSAAGTWVRTAQGFEPSSGTELWRALVTLLPSDDKLSPEVRQGLAASTR